MDYLKQHLQDVQVEKRLEAVRQLLQMPELEQELFLQVLGDDDWRVRKEAILLYLQRPDAPVRVDAIIDQLSNPDNTGLRNAAIEILVGLGTRSMSHLTRQLLSVDAEVRKFIVDIFGEIGQPSCISELLELLHDKDENVRYAVVETLGKLKAIGAVPALIELLEMAETGLQFVILDTLATIGEGVPAEKILVYAENRLLRKSVFSCLGRLGGEQSLSTLLEGLCDPQRKIREAALLALGQIIKALPLDTHPQLVRQDEILELLLEYLRQEDSDLRRSACYALSLFAEADHVIQLLGLLAEDELRADVVAACRRVPREIFIKLLERQGLTDGPVLGLIYLLGELNYGEVVPLAQAGLQSSDPQYRYVSALALGKLGAKEGVTDLSQALTDESADVREAVAVALAQIGAVEPLAVFSSIQPFLGKDAPGQRLLAVKVLGNLPHEMVEGHLLLALKDVESEVRCAALCNLGGDCSRRLLSGVSLALTDENSEVRRLAANALASCPAERKNPVLSHVLDDSDPWVRMAAIRSLSVGSQDETLLLLERGLADSSGLVVIAALEILSRLFPDQAEGPLSKALQQPDPEVFRTAVRLLLDAGQNTLLMAHADAKVRLSAVKELQQAPAEGWLQQFSDRLEIEPDAEICQAMEEALRRRQTGD